MVLENTNIMYACVQEVKKNVPYKVQMAAKRPPESRDRYPHDTGHK
jgi:hypothetical protein